MSGVLIVAACLVFVDRLLFRGQLVSLFIQGCRETIRRPKKAPAAEVQAAPPPVHGPASLIVKKYYADGLERSGAAKTEEEVEKAPKRNIFAVQPPQGGLQMWEDPNFAIEDINPAVKDKEKSKIENVDPEVRRMMEELTDGEPAMPDDYTDEERQAVAGFDSNAFI